MPEKTIRMTPEEFAAETARRANVLCQRCSVRLGEHIHLYGTEHWLCPSALFEPPDTFEAITVELVSSSEKSNA